VLVRELNDLYGAFCRGESDPLPALAIQYADYAAWQRRWLSGEALTDAKRVLAKDTGRERRSYWNYPLTGPAT